MKASASPRRSSHVHAQHHDARARPVALGHLLQHRRLGGAGAAPGGPEVEHHDPAAQVLQRDLGAHRAHAVAGRQDRQGDVRGRRALALGQGVLDRGADVAVEQPDDQQPDDAEHQHAGHDGAHRAAPVPAPAPLVRAPLRIVHPTNVAVAGPRPAVIRQGGGGPFDRAGAPGPQSGGSGASSRVPRRAMDSSNLASTQSGTGPSGGGSRSSRSGAGASSCASGAGGSSASSVDDRDRDVPGDRGQVGLRRGVLLVHDLVVAQHQHPPVGRVLAVDHLEAGALQARALARVGLGAVLREHAAV